MRDEVNYSQKREVILYKYLDRFRKNPTNFMGRFVTLDKKWVYQFTPETRPPVVSAKNAHILDQPDQIIPESKPGLQNCKYFS